MVRENGHDLGPLGSQLNGDYDDDAALEQALALSLQQDKPADPASEGRPDLSGSHARPTVSSAASSSFGTLKLDRKQMEEERLARLRKRSAADAGLDQPSRRPMPAPGTLSNKPSMGVGQNTADEGKRTPPQTTKKASRLRFPKGAVKRTRVKGCARGADDITIEEILDKDELELAVMSSFQWDEEWLLSKIDLAHTKLLLVAFANDEAEKQLIRGNVPSSRIRFCFPPMSGMGCMHSKLQLLKFPGHLRIVVPSGNLVSYDWGETGVMENVVFLIDLPQLDHSANAANSRVSKTTETAFGSELRRFLRAQGLDEALIGSLDKYDFAETGKYGFVHTTAGNHADPTWQDTGYCCLARTVKSLGLGTNRPIHVDYVTSSLGSLNYAYLKALYNACQGKSCMEEFDERQAKQSSKKSKGVAQDPGPSSGAMAPDVADSWTDRFQIYFPTEDTVTGSRGGPSVSQEPTAKTIGLDARSHDDPGLGSVTEAEISGGTISFQDKWWKSPTFPRAALRDAVNTKKGVLMHHKIIFVRETKETNTGTDKEVPGYREASKAWAYLGSANLSESAWGNLVRDRSSGKAKLNCRNWECGVLVPMGTEGVSPQDSSREQGGRQEIVDGMDIFAGTVPVPVDIAAARAYGKAATDETPATRPWIFRR